MAHLMQQSHLAYVTGFFERGVQIDQEVVVIGFFFNCSNGKPKRFIVEGFTPAHLNIARKSAIEVELVVFVIPIFQPLVWLKGCAIRELFRFCLSVWQGGKKEGEEWPLPLGDTTWNNIFKDCHPVLCLVSRWTG